MLQSTWPWNSHDAVSSVHVHYTRSGTADITDYCLYLCSRAGSWSVMKSRPSLPSPGPLWYYDQCRRHSRPPVRARSSCQTEDRPPLVEAPPPLSALSPLTISTPAKTQHICYQHSNISPCHIITDSSLQHTIKLQTLNNTLHNQRTTSYVFQRHL